MADGDLDIDALLEGPIDQKQDRDKSQSKEVRESWRSATMITTVPLEGAETPRIFVVIATAGTRAYRHVGVEIPCLLSKGGRAPAGSEDDVTDDC